MGAIKFAPSILAADFTRLGEQVKEAEAGGAAMIHVDVMDGRFVPNITIGPLVVEAVRRVTSLPLDVHLMIVEPERHVAAFAEAGASRITVHLEASPNLHRTLQHIRELGCGAGVALNPHTPPGVLAEIMDRVDVINVMTVNPGFGGQELITGTLRKVAVLRAMIGEARHPIDLEVDGGINHTTAMSAAQAGADVLIVGTAVFGYPQGIRTAMDELRRALSA
jgi:ribulose-phosphate 3-epimerase